MYAKCGGKIHKLSIKENAKAKITTTGMAVAADAISPGINNIGTKKIMVLITAYITGFNTALAPIKAPSDPGWPLV